MYAADVSVRFVLCLLHLLLAMLSMTEFIVGYIFCCIWVVHQAISSGVISVNRLYAIDAYKRQYVKPR